MAEPTSLSDAEQMDLIDQWSPLARKMARRFKRSEDLLPDLEQEALLGLTVAARDFKPNRANQFGSHATIVISQHLCRYRAKARPIPISYIANKRSIKINRARKVLGSQGEVEPSVERLAGVAGLTVGQAASALASQWHRLPDEPDGFAQAGLEDETRAEEMIDMVLARIDMLAAKNKTVVIRRFGLDGEPPASFNAIGRSMGISGEAVQARFDKSIARIRKAVATV